MVVIKNKLLKSKNILEIRDGGNYENTLKRDNYKCQKCNCINDLFVHHKDKNNKNNKLENLVTLCRTCHAREHWSKMKFGKPTREVIKELREANYTFQQIGNYLGITRQRVHQLFTP